MIGKSTSGSPQLSWNHWALCHAPQPHEPDASEATSTGSNWREEEEMKYHYTLQQTFSTMLDLTITRILGSLKLGALGVMG